MACLAAKITSNGLMELIICQDYGPHMLDVDPKEGNISWLEDPGRESLRNGHRVERFINRWPGMHRLNAGYFTQKSPPHVDEGDYSLTNALRSSPDVIAASVIYRPNDRSSSSRIKDYSPCE